MAIDVMISDTTRQKPTKLSVYKGCVEKTPTGLNNALNLKRIAY